MWIDRLGDLLSPPACAACDAPVGATRAFCPPCAASVLGDASSAEVVAVGAYGGALATAVRRLKYDGRPDLARPLGRLLAAACREAGLEADLVVPVPLHPARLASRGYDQAALIAREVARGLDAPLGVRAIRRVVDTAPLALRGRSDRAATIAGAFVAADLARLSGARVVVVDDVATTGATLSAATAALALAGARVVGAAVIARTLATG